MLDCYVYYNMFDPDKTLFVHKPKHVDDHAYKNGMVEVFKGSESECRKYIIENQKKASTSSVLRPVRFIG